MSKKQFNSLPFKIKKSETKWFKEFIQLQTKLVEKESEMSQTFVGPAMQKQLSKISDEDLEFRLQEAEKLNPQLTTEEKKAMREYLLSYRKSAKP